MTGQVSGDDFNGVVYCFLNVKGLDGLLENLFYSSTLESHCSSERDRERRVITALLELLYHVVGRRKSKESSSMS